MITPLPTDGYTQKPGCASLPFFGVQPTVITPEGKEIEGEWWLILSGLASVVFGVIMAARPGAGALAVLLCAASAAAHTWMFTPSRAHMEASTTRWAFRFPTSLDPTAHAHTRCIHTHSHKRARARARARFLTRARACGCARACLFGARSWRLSCTHARVCCIMHSRACAALCICARARQTRIISSSIIIIISYPLSLLRCAPRPSGYRVSGFGFRAWVVGLGV